MTLPLYLSLKDIVSTLETAYDKNEKNTSKGDTLPIDSSMVDGSWLIEQVTL